MPPPQPNAGVVTKFADENGSHEAYVSCGVALGVVSCDAATPPRVGDGDGGSGTDDGACGWVGVV